MHSSHCQIVEIVMRQPHTTDQNCYDSTKVKIFCGNIAQNTEKIGDDHLCDLCLNQKSKFPKDE